MAGGGASRASSVADMGAGRASSVVGGGAAGAMVPGLARPKPAWADGAVVLGLTGVQAGLQLAATRRILTKK